MLSSVFVFERVTTPLRRIAMASFLSVCAFIQLYGTSQNPLSYYQEFFLTFSNESVDPANAVYFKANILPQQAQYAALAFQLNERDRFGRVVRETSPASFPAPMLDSLYVPQHSMWAGYALMWRLGYRDWYLWNAMFGSDNPDPMRAFR